jgi:hypothetical protein
MTDSNEPRISQKSLEDIKGIEEIQQKLGKMLQMATFEPGKRKGTEICTDPGLPGAAKELLDALGIEVPSLN